MHILKNELSRIRLFFMNVWMLLAADPLHKFIFSISCAVFSLFAAEVMRNALDQLQGIYYALIMLLLGKGSKESSKSGSARKSPYKTLAEQFAIYSDLEKLANNEKNQVILTP